MDESSRNQMNLDQLAHLQKIAPHLFEEGVLTTNGMNCLVDNQTLMNFVPCAVFTVDLNRQITSWNTIAEKVTGYSCAEVIGKSCSLFAIEPCTLRCGLFAHNVTKPIIGKRCAIRHKDGHTIQAIKNLAELRDHTTGEVIGGIECLLDVTQHLLIENRLQNSEKMASLGALTAGIAHEISNPLTIIKCKIIKLEEKAEGTMVEDYKKIENALQRITNILKSMQQLVKHSENISRNFEVNESLLEVTTFIESVFKTDGIQIEKKLCKEPVYIFGSDGKMQQVFLNLFLNAKHALHGKSEKTIHVSSHFTAHTLHITLSDNGCGMDESMLKHVFDPFFQMNPSEEGLGFGLANCHATIASFGGSLSVESVMGEGTTFFIQLPMAAM